MLRKRGYKAGLETRAVKDGGMELEVGRKEGRRQESLPCECDGHPSPNPTHTKTLHHKDLSPDPLNMAWFLLITQLLIPCELHKKVAFCHKRIDNRYLEDHYVTTLISRYGLKYS